MDNKIENLNPAHLQPAEYKRNVWIATAAKGVKPEDMTDPSYWANVAAKLKPWDKIEVRAEDGTWYQEFIVLDASRVWARVRSLVGPVMLGTADISQTLANQVETQFEVLHRGPRGWSVIRKADRAVMAENLSIKGDADKWLTANLASLASGETKPLAEQVKA